MTTGPRASRGPLSAAGGSDREPAPTPLHRLRASTVQQSFFDGADDGRCSFHLMAAVRVYAGYDRGVLVQTLLELRERHEALRTTLHWSGTRLEQLIWEPTVPSIHEQTIESSADAAAVLARLVNEPIELDGSELVRVDVLRAGEDEHVVAVRMHHAIVDDYAAKTVVAELSALYAARLRDEPVTLPPVLAQARDHMAREEKPASAATHAYWRRAFAPRSAAAVPAVPLQPEFPSVVATMHLPTVPADAIDRLAQFAADVRTSRALGLLAALASAFHARGADDLRVGYVHANRYRPEYADLVAAVAEYALLRIDLSGAPTFREMLARAQRVWTEAIVHRLPLAEILSVIEPAAAQRPCCDLEFSYLEQRRTAPLGREGLRIEVEQFDMRDWELHATPENTVARSGYVGSVQGSGALAAAAFFTARTISSAERAIASALDLSATLPALIASPDQPIRNILR